MEYWDKDRITKINRIENFINNYKRGCENKWKEILNLF